LPWYSISLPDNYTIATRYIPTFKVYSGVKFVYNQWLQQNNAFLSGQITKIQYDKWLSDRDIVEYKVSQSYIHPNFSRQSVTFVSHFNSTSNWTVVDPDSGINDMALLRLNQTVRSVGPRRNAICLPTEDYVKSDMPYAVTAGYGRTPSLPAQITALLTEVAIKPSNFILTINTTDGGNICKVNLFST
jgi:hypothetical protein